MSAKHARANQIRHELLVKIFDDGQIAIEGCENKAGKNISSVELEEFAEKVYIASLKLKEYESTLLSMQLDF